jgi:hypothetical protein
MGGFSMGYTFLIIGVMALVLGISMFLPARNARKQDLIHDAWPKVKGTVMSSEVVAQPPLPNRTGKLIFQYDVAVKYQFRTGGQLHFGSTISLPRYLYGKEDADRMAARYPAGAAVTVQHNPEDVRECYLEIAKTARFFRTSLVITIAGGIFTLLGFILGMG